MLLIEPPLINSSNPWATTREDLEALFNCPYTGAVTIRTSLLQGFRHDEAVHQRCFFNTNSPEVQTKDEGDLNSSSLNTLGYSPITLAEYLDIVEHIEEAAPKSETTSLKPFIFSVTGTAEEVCESYKLLLACRGHKITFMEINLSCPNIVDKPPPAYSKEELSHYITELQKAVIKDQIKVGLKVPPYTYQDQFDNLIDALLQATQGDQQCPISFITSTNTLGRCLIMGTDLGPALASSDSTGIGGMGGAAIHPLSLGNVKTISRMLKVHQKLRHISIIGTGGVSDEGGFKRMRTAGAEVVGVGTALGARGISVFQTILGD